VLHVSSKTKLNKLGSVLFQVSTMASLSGSHLLKDIREAGIVTVRPPVV
jgi:hypothetical protein